MYCTFRLDAFVHALALAAASFIPLAAAEDTLTYSWRGIGSTGVFPAGELVTEFSDIPAGAEMTPRHRRDTLPDWAMPGSRRNVVWRTQLPHWGNNVPVVMGDRVYLLCEEGWKSAAPELVCLSVTDGTILWQRPVDHLDAWPEAKRAEAKAIRAQEQDFWRRHMRAWHAVNWDDEQHDWATISRKEAERRVAQALEDGWDFSSHITTAFGDAGPEAVKKMRSPAGGNGQIRNRFPLRRAGEAIRAEVLKVSKACVEQRIYWRQGWTSENPWYGNTMGSVVGDGERIYAVTALGGATAYAPDGTRLWVADLGLKPNGHFLHVGTHGNMASPVLAAGHLVYYAHSNGTLYGLDCASGTIAWQTPAPKGPPVKKGKVSYRGHAGHMAPGGTPVVLTVAGETVVVTGHGMTVRVRDGAYLGQLRFVDAVDRKGKPTAKYSGGYCSWAAMGDVVYGCHMAGQVFAFRLGIADDRLTQEVLWRSQAFHDMRSPNLVIWGDWLYAEQRTRGPVGICAIERHTGEPGPVIGRICGGYATNYAVTPDGLVVARQQDWHNRFHPGWGATRNAFVVRDLAGDRRGEGFLAVPELTDEIRDRHIAFIGMPYLAWGPGGIGAWGNRIFIRNSDYIWCIGDPEKEWVGPERYLK